jgi:hypothetical protein
MAKNLLHCETGFGVYRSTQQASINWTLRISLIPTEENVPVRDVLNTTLLIQVSGNPCQWRLVTLGLGSAAEPKSKCNNK